jgi:hypothetical protein
MRALVRYILSGPMQAVVVVYGFAILSLPFPFLVICSGAALALVAMQVGLSQSIKVMLISGILFSLTTYFLIERVSIVPLYAWLAVILMATVYRNTRSLSLSLQLLMLLGVISVLLIAVVFPDLKNQWLNFMQSAFKTIEKDPALQGVWQSANLSPEKLDKYLPFIASIMTGLLASLLMLSTAITIFLGRWWQGFQENIRSFREEFIAIRLGKVLAIFAIVLIIAALVLNYAVLWQLALVCLSIFSIQGMAIVHAFIVQFSNSTIGFVLVYGLLFVAAPQMIVALSALGVIDTFFNFRNQFVKS